MPRPKGSKNKKATAPAIVTSSVEEIEQKMAAVEAEITSLSEQLKNRKAELKGLRNCNLLDATNWLWRYNIIPLAMKDIF